MFFTLRAPAAGAITGIFWRMHNIDPSGPTFLMLEEMKFFDPLGERLVTHGTNVNPSRIQFDTQSHGTPLRGRAYSTTGPNAGSLSRAFSTADATSVSYVVNTTVPEFIFSFADAGDGDGPIGAVNFASFVQCTASNADTAGDGANRYIAGFDLSYSNDGTWDATNFVVDSPNWILYASVTGIAFPGEGTCDAAITFP